MAQIDNNSDNKDILEACYQGDSNAINIFFARYKDLIYTAIHKWINKYAKVTERMEDVKEIFQEAVMDIMEDGFRKLKQARDQNRISGLIFMIVYHRAGKYFKKKWKAQHRREDENSENGQFKRYLDILEVKEKIEIVDKFIAGLNPIEKKILELRFSDGLRYKEIAEKTGLSTTNVGVLISRLKERLKRFIMERYPSFSNIM